VEVLPAISKRKENSEAQKESKRLRFEQTGTRSQCCCAESQANETRKKKVRKNKFLKLERWLRKRGIGL
jgi:hypothetical protein